MDSVDRDVFSAWIDFIATFCVLLYSALRCGAMPRHRPDSFSHHTNLTPQIHMDFPISCKVNQHSKMFVCRSILLWFIRSTDTKNKVSYARFFLLCSARFWLIWHVCMYIQYILRCGAEEEERGFLFLMFFRPKQSCAGDCLLGFGEFAQAYIYSVPRSYPSYFLHAIFQVPNNAGHTNSVCFIFSDSSLSLRSRTPSAGEISKMVMIF